MGSRLIGITAASSTSLIIYRRKGMKEVGAAVVTNRYEAMEVTPMPPVCGYVITIELGGAGMMDDE